ncbi:MAG TPA: UDP-N-acetylglucosamine--N-acetylmuramyl-(pentapeptide) pyrophosphoryl-undecaprenol N-acetylglucosamine transferase [Phycisphaerae bacterium]|nr:UDP-N-acetylglucosamine--N-acetylmuramyl-(pentapeptide) pyrophosphoryl-undecaprenol N-acetylglucosamine transferase [Phycisphaerae bacterium]
MTTVVWPHRANPLLGMMSQASDTSSSRAVSTTSKTLRVVMAGGGTGGHLYPGLAVAEALRSLAEAKGMGLELTWAATPRAVDQRLLSGFGEGYVKQPVQPLVKSIGKLIGFVKGWRESCGIWGRRFMSPEQRPDCVVALGGYAAGPAAYVAGKRGVPVVLLNPDALPGLANRFLIKRATTVVTQWAWGAAGVGGREYAKHIKGKVKALGCPIRAELVGRSREEGAARLGIDAGKKTLVVTGASLGAKTINEAVLVFLETAAHREALVAGGWQIVHLAGVEQAEGVRAAYAKWPEVHVKVIDYCDDMASVWAVADAAIARAGASTCAELTACGVPAILLPYPFHKDMHQKANAMELVRAGAAFIVDDAKEASANASAIKPALESLLYDEELRDRMAEAARVVGKPGAAVEIAKEILALVGESLR